MRYRRALLLSLLLGAGLGGCGNGKSKSVPDASPSAPQFTLPSTQGQKVALSGFLGQPVFLDFWATWCPPCRSSMPEVEKLHKDFGSRGLQVLGINMDEDVSAVAPFAKDMGLSYPILLDPEGQVSRLYKVRAIPVFYLLDKQGRVAAHWEGYSSMSPTEWRRTAEELLKP